MSNKAAVSTALEAGGLTPCEGRAPEDTDVVDARSFAHPALGTRRVVRLVASPLAPGEDLEMEFLGFDKPKVAPKLAFRRRQPLGFPGWALINDPEHARYALEVVKELKKALRKARSKPGHANDMVEAIAVKLSRSVPHFLPTFYEEVGRTHIELGNLQWASQAIAKARKAERVHTLKVDEAHRRQAFLEFSLAGAVTNQALEEYAKDLASSHDAEEAYRHFRELCRRRTLGGGPPWAGMGKELRRLAKAAKLDVDKEEQALLTELLEAPSVTRAAFAFWKHYEKPLVVLAKRDAAMRGRLLNLFPTCEQAQWLSVLRECGALEGLFNSEAPAAAQPNGCAGEWLTKFLDHAGGPYGWGDTPAEILPVLRELSPRLRSEGKPVRLHTGKFDHNRRFDLDVLELALSEQVPVEIPGSRVSIDLAKWTALEGVERHRDPAHVASSEHFAPLLDHAIGPVLGERDFEARCDGRPAFVKAKARWSAKRVELLHKGGLPDFAQAVEHLAGLTARTLRELPSLTDALAGAHVSTAVHRSLRGGHFDELGWPALDALLEKLDAKAPLFAGAFPYLIVTDRTRAFVLHANGETILEHDLRIAKGRTLQTLLYAAGELFVVLKEGYESVGYWSGTPDVVKKIEGYFWHEPRIRSLALPVGDSGISYGEGPIQPGTFTVPSERNLLHDGETAWRVEASWDPQGGRSIGFVELDPKTGKTGRRSMPRFIEEIADEAWAIETSCAALFPVPVDVSESPLGGVGRMYGFRARTRKDDPTHFEVEALGGRRFSGRLAEKLGGSERRHGVDASSRVPCALLSLPGDAVFRPVSVTEKGYTLWAPDGQHRLAEPGVKDRAYGHGSGVVLPLSFWHCLRPRDPAGSRALRSLSLEAARKLTDAAHRDRDVDSGQPHAIAALKEVLPEVHHRRLQEGILGLLWYAAQQQGALDKILERRAATASAGVEGVRTVSDGPLAAGLWRLSGQSFAGNVLGQLMCFAAWFETGKLGDLSPTDIDWPRLLSKIPALAFRTVAPGVEAETRSQLLGFLDALASSVFLDGSPTRVLAATFKEMPPFGPTEKVKHGYQAVEFGTGTQGNSRYVFFSVPNHYAGVRPWTMIERGGGPDLPEGVTVTECIDVQAPSREWLRGFLALARERPPLEWNEAVIAHLQQRTGLTRGEAVLLWGGFPRFVSKPDRETLRLKKDAIDLAERALGTLNRDELARILGAAVTGDPSQLWQSPTTDDGPVARMSAVWNEVVGRRAELPDAVLKDFQRYIPGVPAITMLNAIRNPSRDALFSTDAKWLVDARGMPTPADKEKAFGAQQLVQAVCYAALLQENLPVGDPVLRAVPGFIEQVHKRLESSALLLPLCSGYGEDMKAARTFVEAVGGTPIQSPEAGPSYDPILRDLGIAVVGANKWSFGASFRPSRVKDPTDPELARIWRAFGVAPGAEFDAFRVIRSAGFGRILDRIRQTKVPVGQYEANPKHSAPDVLDRVRARYQLGEDAAALYLQTLALRAPTTQRIKEFNGWSSSTYNAAAAELTAKKLVVEAKRARAGRSHFLPGGWGELKPPLLPMELWKYPLFDITEGPFGIDFPLATVLPWVPVHELFETAWARIEAGDVPAYEEVK